MKISPLAIIFLAAAAAAQTTAPTAPTAMISRTIKAMHYNLRGGSLKIDFQGSDLMQHAAGEAKVEGKKTNFEIDAKFEGFEDATKFGLEYLTYVLWAVSPQGRPRQSVARHAKPLTSITSLGPNTSSGWNAEAGSGTSISSSTLNL